MAGVADPQTAEPSADGQPAHHQPSGRAEGSVRGSEVSEAAWAGSRERATSRARYSALFATGTILILAAALSLSFRHEFYESIGPSHKAGVRLGILSLIVGLVGAVVFSWGFVSWLTARDRFDAAQRALREVDKALGEVSGPNDLMGFIRVNRKQMDAYDALARSQAQTSYQASLAAMGIGLLVLGAGIAVVISSHTDATKYAAAIITASGAAVSGFIANTFINVYRHASKQLNFYFRQPLVQSYLLSAERIAGLMPDSPGERYAEQVSAILAVAATAQADSVHEKRDSNRRSPRLPGSTRPVSGKETGSS